MCGRLLIMGCCEKRDYLELKESRTASWKGGTYNNAGKRTGLPQDRRQRTSREEDGTWKKIRRMQESALDTTAHGVVTRCPFTLWNASRLLPGIRAAAGPGMRPQACLREGAVSMSNKAGESKRFVCRRSQLSPPAWLQPVCSGDSVLVCVPKPWASLQLPVFLEPSLFCGILGGAGLECPECQAICALWLGLAHSRLTVPEPRVPWQHPEPGEGDKARRWVFLEMGLRFLTKSLPRFPGGKNGPSPCVRHFPLAGAHESSRVQDGLD